MQKKTYILDSQIQLREVGQNDIAPIFHTINSEREYLGKWLPFVNNSIKIEDTKKFIDNIERSDSLILTFSIYCEDVFVGIIGFKDYDTINKKIEIGYWLSEAYQGKGIITKSCNKLIEIAFNDLSINRIQIKVATENVRSQKVAESLGFTFEGIERAGELHQRGFLDLMIYSLLNPNN